MKKRTWLLLFLVLAGIILCVMAGAEEARDITSECKVTGSAGKYKITRVYDRDLTTYWTSEKEKNSYVQIMAPKGEKIWHLYVCFWDKLDSWRLQVYRNGDWKDVETYAARYAHEYVQLDGVDGVRVACPSGKRGMVSLNEVYVFSEGDIPDWVQRWEDAPDKVDMMILSAHPDDEILFFGGTLPFYAGEKGLNVLVAYMTCGTYARRSELLNGLWTCGVRIYPSIGDFWDKFSKKLDTGYSAWGKTQTWTYVTELLRRYKPDVLLTHDVNGEYGHGAHRVCADAAQRCVSYAADASKYADSANQYGVWQVKKLYIHLYNEGQIEMDWDQPLEHFEGKTGFEVAQDAYKEHVTQQTSGQKNAKTGKMEYFEVEPRSSAYSCYLFGLAFTTVGPDVNGNDFLENIP